MAFGPLSNIDIPIFGIESPTPAEVMKEIPPGTIPNAITAFVGATISPNGDRLCVAFGDDILVFRKAN